MAFEPVHAKWSIQFSKNWLYGKFIILRGFKGCESFIKIFFAEMFASKHTVKILMDLEYIQNGLTLFGTLRLLL